MANTRRFKPTKARLKQITQWIEDGYTEASVAKKLGYSPTHFSLLKKQVPELSEAIEMGRVDLEQEGHDRILVLARSASTDTVRLNAWKYFLDRRCGWNDKLIEEVKQALIETITDINITTVDGKDPQQFLDEIEQQKENK